MTEPFQTHRRVTLKHCLKPCTCREPKAAQARLADSPLIETLS